MEVFINYGTLAPGRLLKHFMSGRSANTGVSTFVFRARVAADAESALFNRDRLHLNPQCHIHAKAKRLARIKAKVIAIE